MSIFNRGNDDGQSNNKEIILKSKSGLFLCDAEYYAYAFYPSLQNMVGESAVRNLIIPEGVAGFADSFCRSLTVVEQFSIPNTVKSIGSNWYTKEYCPNGADSEGVFADCRLPTVILPESLKLLGIFAFGNSEIDTLCLPANYRSWRCTKFRAMKGARVKHLFIPDVFSTAEIVRFNEGMKGRPDFSALIMRDIELGPSECTMVYREKEEGTLPQDFISLDAYGRIALGDSK
ncbi:MAG: leucine-rich repeat domain-containing protein [Clostridiales bacterium]|nr:leucine-rich repeat domain-containing protein [Clostridiales bacterium]